jgi:hypothetical protein
MKLKLELQRTLSFIEPMNMEMIYLDISSEYLLTNKDDTIEDLQKALAQLIKEKKVKVIIQDKHKYWIKIYPKRSLLKRISLYFSKR